MKLSEMKKDQGQTILAVGPSGTGKSIAMCSYPSPVLNLSLDQRMVSVAEWFSGTKQLDGIEYEDYMEFNELNDRVDSLEYDCPYKTVILDPISFLSSMLMRYSFSLRGKGKGQVEGRKRGKVNLTTVDDYGVEHQGIENLIYNLKLVGKKHNANIIVVAHIFSTTYYKEGGKESNTVNTILTQGKRIAALLPGMFNEVYNFFNTLEMGKTQYRVRTANDGTTDARSSFKRMPDEIDWTDCVNFHEFIKQFYASEERG